MSALTTCFDLARVDFRFPEIRARDRSPPAGWIRRGKTPPIASSNLRDRDHFLERGAAFGKGQQLAGQMSRVLRRLARLGKERGQAAALGSELPI